MKERKMNHDLIRAEGSFHSSVHRMMNGNSGKKSHTSPVLAVSVGSVLELAEHGERQSKSRRGLLFQDDRIN